MLRSIGSVTFLALFMVGCGGGGSDPSSSPPPPPPPPTSPTSYTVGGTVTGLVGSGLQLAICHPGNYEGRGGGCQSITDIQANGAFTLYSGKPFTSTENYVSIYQQPSSPVQRCLISNTAIDIQSSSNNKVNVTCASFLYVTNAGDNTLISYIVDPTTGALTVIGSPTATGTSPHAIVGYEYPPSTIRETMRFVIVGNAGSNDASAFAVNNATGALSILSAFPFAASMSPQAMAVDNGDLVLDVANVGSDSIALYPLYPLDPALGPLSGSATAATGRGPTSIVNVYPNIYVANHGGSNDISAFNTNLIYMPDGSRNFSLNPLPGSPFPAGGNPLSLVLGAGGKFLYSANPDATNPSISGFSFDPNTAALIPLSGSPFPLPVSSYIASDQTGTFLYVTSGASIVGYAVDATTGALAPLPGFPVAAGANAYSITIDPTNQFLYVANDGAANISGFKLDASTGALTPMPGSPFPAGNHPQFIATF